MTKKVGDYFEEQMRDIDHQLDALRPFLATKENEREALHLMRLRSIYARCREEMRRHEALEKANKAAAVQGFRAEYV